jgi:uncharacterized membrane protein SpoIIM required for sporulation
MFITQLHADNIVLVFSQKYSITRHRMQEERTNWFTSQIVLSSLIVVLSLCTAYVSYERSLASSAQLRQNTAGLRELMLGTSSENMANATFQSDLSNLAMPSLPPTKTSS